MTVHGNQLFTDARAGSKIAVGELLDQYRVELDRVARIELGSSLVPKESGSDVVQETLLAAYADFENFHGQTVEELRAWLTKIVLNRSVDVARRYRLAEMRQISREQREPYVALDQLPVDASSPSEGAMTRESTHRMQNAVESLLPHQQDVIRLRYNEKLTFAQIATRLKCSPYRARRVWYAAVKCLNRALGEVS